MTTVSPTQNTRAGSSSSSSSRSTSPPPLGTTTETPEWYESTPILIGIGLGALFVLITIAVAIGCTCGRRKKKKKRRQGTPAKAQGAQVQMANMRGAPSHPQQQPHIVAHGPPGTGTVVIANPHAPPPHGPYPGQPQGQYPGQPHPGQPRGPHPGQPRGPYPGQPRGPHPGQPRGPYPGPPRGPNPGPPRGPSPGGPPQGPPPAQVRAPHPGQPRPPAPGKQTTQTLPRNTDTAKISAPSTNTLPPSAKFDNKYPHLAGERPPTMKDDKRYIQFEVPPPSDSDQTNSAPVVANNKIEEMAQLISRSIAKTLAAINIEPEKIKRQDVLGSGQYGVVYKGEYIPTDDMSIKAPVALKTIAGDASDEKDMTDFMDEMLRMKSFSHPNVMPMMGMTILDDKPYMVLPYMQFGDLKSYISKRDRTFLVEDLMRVCLQVTRGMEYLAAQHIIHGDLAARNCMVGKEGMVKVADFGLSRHLIQSNYYSLSNSDQLRPLRWMAPECIFDQKYSTKSDVWAFGILVYEVMTRGSRPYPDMKTNEEVMESLSKGYRMPCPVHTAEEIYEIMNHCWSEESANRPSFKDLGEQIIMLIEQSGADYELPLKVAGQGQTLKHDTSGGST